MPKGNEIGFAMRGPEAALTNRATSKIIQQQACLIAVETSNGLFSSPLSLIPSERLGALIHVGSVHFSSRSQ